MGSVYGTPRESVTIEDAHRLAREKGVSRRLYFRMHASGAEHVPSAGAAIIAPNHKSFLDSFFIAVCIPRQLRFMAKSELIEARYAPLSSSRRWRRSGSAGDFWLAAAGAARAVRTPV
jgi:Acyltransferase